MSPNQTARRPSRPAASPAGKGSKPAARGRAPAAPPARKRRFPIALVAGGVLALGLVAVIVVTAASGGGDDNAPLEVGSPSVTGEALSAFTPGTEDPAVGLLIPEVSGADFDGTPVSITRDGRAKVILFVAHWCSVCQQEIPLLADWLPGADLPDDVDLITVNTGVYRDQQNYPPSEWFSREGWTLPVLMDDEARSVAQAFGLGAYPYWVFVDADGNVYQRGQGGMTTDDLAGMLAELSQA